MTAPVVVTLGQLREALRVAEEADAALQGASETDSVQVHLFDRNEYEGVLVVELLSNEAGQPVARWSVDTDAGPGCSGVAEPLA